MRLAPTWFGRAAVLLAGLAFGMAVLVAAPPSAHAHSDLIASNPTADAQLTQPPSRLVLRFGEDVDPRFATVTLAVDGDDPVTLQKQVDGPTVTAAPPAGTAAGRWSVAYRIVSVDGHPVSGRVAFSITPVAAPRPTRTPSAPPTPTPPATASTIAPPSASAPVAPATGAGRNVWSKWPIIILVILTLMGGPAAAAAYGLGARPGDGTESSDELDTPPDDAEPGEDPEVPPTHAEPTSAGGDGR